MEFVMLNFHGHKALMKGGYPSNLIEEDSKAVPTYLLLLCSRFSSPAFEILKYRYLSRTVLSAESSKHCSPRFGRFPGYREAYLQAILYVWTSHTHAITMWRFCQEISGTRLQVLISFYYKNGILIRFYLSLTVQSGEQIIFLDLRFTSPSPWFWPLC